MKWWPKKGALVTVYWWDAFAYTDKNTKYFVNKTRGEWNEIYEAKYKNHKMKYVDIIQESADHDNTEPSNGTQEGCRIPLGWIIKVEEHEKRN